MTIRPPDPTLRLAAIVVSSDDAIVSKDLNGIITSWNRGAEELFGYTADEAVGQSITIVIPPDRLAEEEMVLGLVPISLTVSPIRDAAGVIVGASKIARNISYRRQRWPSRSRRRRRTGLPRCAAHRLGRCGCNGIDDTFWTGGVGSDWAACSRCSYRRRRDAGDGRPAAHSRDSTDAEAGAEHPGCSPHGVRAVPGSDHIAGQRVAHASREADRPSRTPRRCRDTCAQRARHELAFGLRATTRSREPGRPVESRPPSHDAVNESTHIGRSPGRRRDR